MKYKVVGTGGAGMNILNALIDSGLDKKYTISLDTSINARSASKAPFLQIGKDTCKGRGSDQVCIGLMAAKESEDDIIAELCGAEAIILAAGLGGGFGTAAVSYIARIARERNIKTFSVVTAPAVFEGKRRIGIAAEEIYRLRKILGENLIVLPIVPIAGGMLNTLYDDSNETALQKISAIIEALEKENNTQSELNRG